MGGVAKQSPDKDDKTDTDAEVSRDETTSEDAATAENPEGKAPDGDEATTGDGPEAWDGDAATATTRDDTPDATAAPETDAEAKAAESEATPDYPWEPPSADSEPAAETRTDSDDAIDPATPGAPEAAETADPERTDEFVPEGQAARDMHDDEARETQNAPERDTPTAPPPQTVVERRGPGFVPLVLGGIVAAGLGYFASVAELVPGLGQPAPSPEVQAALDRQAETLASLEAQLASLAEAEAAPAADLGPVTDEIAGLAARIDETAAAIAGLSDRVVTLEERPVFSGDVTADAAEAAEAVAAMEEQIRQREEEAAARAAEAEAQAQAARDAAAAAQAEADAARARAEAEAALTALRLAVTRGAPFAEPLADVAEVAEIPEPLSAAAETGVPSLEDLQDRFPAAARAALPVALRETAGDSPVDRFAAFVQGQVGGRAVAPREGDSVDAILSRVQGAVTAGDLDAALAEIANLPEGAQAELARWTADAEARVEVLSALETVTQALDGVN
jgi:hypothetical protein